MTAIEFVREEYIKRRKKNARYSLRAFAVYLQIPAGRLSELLSGKRTLTRDMAAKISDSLGFAPEKKAKFLSEVARFERQTPLGASDATYTQLSSDFFQIIAEAYHYSLLNLIETEDFQNDPVWISSRLGISVIEVHGALQRLERVGLIENRDGVLRRKESNITTTHDVPSPALRASHRQSLEQAIECLEGVVPDQRDISSITFPSDPERMKIAKEHIRTFRRSMSELMSQGKKTEVYNLNIQLVPVTKLRSSK